MKKLTLAIAIVALTSLTPGPAFASNPTSTPRHGHDTGGHDAGDGDAPVVEGAREIKVKAGRFRYKPKTITIATGEDVTIAMKSTDLFHDFVVKGIGHVVGAERKKTGKGGLRIDESGTYKYWCSVPGHKAAGMKGKIIVE